jgi:hypothetical protein
MHCTLHLALSNEASSSSIDGRTDGRTRPTEATGGQTHITLGGKREAGRTESEKDSNEKSPFEKFKCQSPSVEFSRQIFASNSPSNKKFDWRRKQHKRNSKRHSRRVDAQEMRSATLEAFFSQTVMQRFQPADNILKERGNE